LLLATHNGSFHCDDVFSITVMKLLTPECTVIRTRDIDLIKSADMRIDVGQRYDPSTGDFDHHQKGGAGIHEQSGIRRSSIGLIWQHYGLELITKLYGDIKYNKQIWKRVNWNLIQVIDAGDVGTKIYESLYDGVQPYTISQIISNFNPSWDVDVLEYDVQFDRAVNYAKIILINEIEDARNVVVAKDKVLQCIRKARDENSKVIVFDQHVPWMGTLIKNTYDELYVVYPSENKDWRIQCIPDSSNSFNRRKSLPKLWGGASVEELNRLIGISDAVFCHTARFVAGAKSFESIMKMAELAISLKE